MMISTSPTPKFGLLTDRQERALRPFMQQITSAPRPERLVTPFEDYVQTRRQVLNLSDQQMDGLEQQYANQQIIDAHKDGLEQHHANTSSINSDTAPLVANFIADLIAQNRNLRKDEILATVEIERLTIEVMPQKAQALLDAVKSGSDAKAVLSMMVSSTLEFGDKLFDALSLQLNRQDNP